MINNVVSKKLETLVEKEGVVKIRTNDSSVDPTFLCPSGCGCTRYYSCGCGPGPLSGGIGRE